MAFGCLGLTITQFEQHTPETLQAAIEGFKEQEKERERNEWERTRFLAFYIRNVLIQKPLRRPSDWFKFEWEQPEKKPQTAEQTEAAKLRRKLMSDRFDAIAANNFK